MAITAMRGWVAWCAAATLLIVLTGCGGPQPIQPATDPERAMLYGHIAVAGYLSDILVAELGVVYVGPFKQPPRAHVYENGNFFVENLTPGQYYFFAFRVSGQWIYMTYEDEQTIRAATFQVHPASVVYMGSYRIGEEESGFFEADQFSLNLVDSPLPGDILEQLAVAAQGTGWDERMGQERQRLR